MIEWSTLLALNTELEFHSLGLPPEDEEALTAATEEGTFRTPGTLLDVPSLGGCCCCGG